MTILFKQDWQRHPKAVIHYETRNESFIRICEIYYNMGLLNNAFPLALLDPDLKDIDPKNEDLPREIKEKVLYECKHNFWYYIREVVSISIPGSSKPVQFRANRANIALYWLYFNHITSLLVIMRQAGKTTMLMTLASYLLDMGAVNTLINLLTKSESLKSETLSKLKEIIYDLPSYIRFADRKDIFNSDEANVRLLGNKLKGNLSSSSPKQAEKVGRGLTSGTNFLDEICFIENLAIAMGAMLMAGNAARAYAQENNTPYGTILSTTAGDTDDRDGAYAYSLFMGSTTLNEKLLYDSPNRDELVKNVYNNCASTKNAVKTPIVSIYLSHRQLGYDEEWLKKRLEENISTPENIQRDIFNQWMSGSGKSPIPQKYLDEMKAAVVEVPRSELFSPYGHLLEWYISEEEVEYRIAAGHNFVAGVDTSDGAGRDDIALVLRDHTSGEVICTAIFNEINLIALASFFVDFLLKYLNTVMIIERRSSAPAIIDYMIEKFLQYNVNPYRRLYNTIYQNKDERKAEYEELESARYYDSEVYNKYRKYIGFATSGTGVNSRSELYSTVLMSMMKYTGKLLYSKMLIVQISSLVIRNNRVDHPAGGNDDLVVASLLSYWLLINGRNLALYEIDVYSILKQNKTYLEEKYSNDTTLLTSEEAAEQEDAIAKLMDKYKNEQDEIISAQLELSILRLAKGNVSSKNILSTEEMLADIRRNKKLLRRY